MRFFDIRRDQEVMVLDPGFENDTMGMLPSAEKVYIYKSAMSS